MADILYDLESYNLLEFGLMTDESIKLPRYQRPGSQWNEEKRLGFLMSVLFGLPTGFITERLDNNGIKWLIDGRQRRECIDHLLNPCTLAKIVESVVDDEVLEFDQVNKTKDIDKRIYKFARTWLQEYDRSAEDKYRQYEKAELIELCDEKGIYTTTNDTNDELIKKLVANENDTGLGLEEDKKEKLQPLVDLMKLMEGWADEGKPIVSGFAKKFRWNNHKEIYNPEVSNGIYYPKFYLRKNGKWNYQPEIFGSVIRDFYNEKRWDKRCTNTSQFVNYLKSESNDVINSEKLTQKWDSVKDDTDLLYQKMTTFKKKFEDSKIGKIHLLEQCTAFEGMKIFTIINSQGVTLSGIQLLAAWPEWNQPLYDEDNECNNEDLIKEVDSLYQMLGVDYDGEISKWDVAATLVNRMDDEFLWNHKTLISIDNKNVSKFEGKTTKGFQLLAGMHGKNMGKSGYKNIHKDISDETWRNNRLVEDHNQMVEQLFLSDYFSALKTWLQKPGGTSAKWSMKRFLTDFQLLSYQVSLTKYFVELGRPTSGSKLKKFQRNAFLIFDELFYQNLNDLWGGQGDNKAQIYIEKINEIPVPNGTFEGVSEGKWVELLNQLMGGEINQGENKGDILTPNSDLSQSFLSEKLVGEYKETATKQSFPPVVQNILIHYYSIRKIIAPENNWVWDHIIADNYYKTTDPEIKKFCNNLANCQALSANLNNLKSDKKLNDDSLEVAVKVEMKKYSGIKEEKYDEYSNVLNSEKLVRERGKEIINQFKTSRREINTI